MTNLIESMSDFQLLEYLKLAIMLQANPSYVDLIQEEIFMRMEVEGA